MDILGIKRSHAAWRDQKGKLDQAQSVLAKKPKNRRAGLNVKEARQNSNRALFWFSARIVIAIALLASISGCAIWLFCRESKAPKAPPSIELKTKAKTFDSQALAFLQDLEQKGFSIPGWSDFFTVIKTAIANNKIHFKGISRMQMKQMFGQSGFGRYDYANNTVYYDNEASLNSDNFQVILHELCHAFRDLKRAKGMTISIDEGWAYSVQLRYALFLSGHRTFTPAVITILKDTKAHSTSWQAHIDDAFFAEVARGALSNDNKVWSQTAAKYGKKYRELKTLVSFTRLLRKYSDLLIDRPWQAQDLRWTTRGKFPVTIPKQVLLDAAPLWRDGNSAARIGFWESSVLPVLRGSLQPSDHIPDSQFDG